MLIVSLVSVGRTKAGAERELASRYLDRARVAGRAVSLTIESREIAESRARRAPDRKAEEAEALRSLIDGKGTTLVALDETGTSPNSEAFTAILRRALDEGGRSLAFVIGGPDGLDESIRTAAAHVIAFGAMTWPHQLVRIMAAEQIYRSVTILSGHPYHRP